MGMKLFVRSASRGGDAASINPGLTNPWDINPEKCGIFNASLHPLGFEVGSWPEKIYPDDWCVHIGLPEQYQPPSRDAVLQSFKAIIEYSKRIQEATDPKYWPRAFVGTTYPRLARLAGLLGFNTQDLPLAYLLRTGPFPHLQYALAHRNRETSVYEAVRPMVIYASLERFGQIAVGKDVETA